MKSLQVKNMLSRKAQKVLLTRKVTFALNLFLLNRLRNKFSEFILSCSRCSLPWLTSGYSCPLCIFCVRHESQPRRRRDSNPRHLDPWSDTLPLDQISSTLQLLNSPVQFKDTIYMFYKALHSTIVL